MVDASEIELQSKIGTGSFGEVFRGSWRGTEVAIKVIPLQKSTVKDSIFSQCKKEMDILL